MSLFRMEKEFDRRNEKKKDLEIELSEKTLFFHEGEIWWCAIGINLGVEMDGKHDFFERPVLVVKKFNKDMFWGMPLTSREHSGVFYEKVCYAGKCSWVIISQARAMSSKRLFRKIGKISEKEIASVRSIWKSLI